MPELDEDPKTAIDRGGRYPHRRDLPHTAPIIIAGAFVLAIIIGMVAVNVATTRTNQSIDTSPALRAPSTTGSGTGTSTTPAPSTPAAAAR